jgi:DNA-binding HxlR family transcriptional regulator
MEIHEIPAAFQSKIRLTIISSLYQGSLNFRDLKEITGASDGNLGNHLSKLVDEGFVTTVKSFIGGKPNTAASLTDRGRQKFEEYVSLLDRIVDEGKNTEE